MKVEIKFAHAFFYFLLKDEKLWCKSDFNKCCCWHHFLFFELDFILLNALYSKTGQKKKKLENYLKA